MPLYDYTCQECSHSFEKRLHMEDYLLPTTEPCPECGQSTVTKDLCAPAFVDPVRLGVSKAPSDFQKYVLGRIKNSVPNNKIGESRSITKEI